MKQVAQNCETPPTLWEGQRIEPHAGFPGEGDCLKGSSFFSGTTVHVRSLNVHPNGNQMPLYLPWQACFNRMSATPSSRRVVFVFLAVLLSSLSSLSAQEAQQPTLAWKFAVGDQFDVEFQQQQDVLTRIDARDRTLESEMILAVRWDVTAVSKTGVATIDQTIKRVRIRTGTPGAEVKKLVDVDTDRETTPRGVSRQVMELVEQLVDHQFILEIAADGKVNSLEASPELVSVLAGFPETSALKGVFSATEMKRLASESPMMLAEEAVAQGDSWSNQAEVSIITGDGRELDFVRNVNSTATEISSKQAKIGIEIELSQKPLPEKEVASALTSPLELKSFSGVGEMRFDRSLGIVSSSKVTSVLKTCVVYREDQVKTTINMTNHVTVKKVK